ncbi:hypothetical protein EMQ_2247 [Acetobacter aceti NBRC 14818]|uniref:Uncharacterized protein n=1 Tax=Acetobacter aceti NBRC 14818 TaxID=887700 RepID=A0AB33IFJ6_ACEAC|nr:hypothetical protein EMQ_2247 [Acetobacter aceti NBRC 14818]
MRDAVAPEPGEAKPLFGQIGHIERPWCAAPSVLWETSQPVVFRDRVVGCRERSFAVARETRSCPPLE